MTLSHGIPLKKQYGQHFLRDNEITDTMIRSVTLSQNSSVFEIGCGDGFLTREILESHIARLWVFEIDSDWANYVKESIIDSRLSVHECNFLDIDFSMLETHAPWIVLANLPYQVTFPILHTFQKNRHLIVEGVVMIQEEVAQKLVKTGGRDYGFSSLFFQHFFEMKLLDKIPPTAFVPPPKVFSRLLYFRPRTELVAIPDEERFWKFIKICFSQPRRTLRNNLVQTQYQFNVLGDDILKKRAQELCMQDLLVIWDLVRNTKNVTCGTI